MSPDFHEIPHCNYGQFSDFVFPLRHSLIEDVFAMTEEHLEGKCSQKLLDEQQGQVLLVAIQSHGSRL